MATQQETAVLSVLLNGEQAKNEISDMEKKAEELKRRIKEAGKDSGPGKKFAGEPVETGKTVRDLNKHVLEADRVLNNLSTAKPGELRAALPALNRQLQFSDIERGSEKRKRIRENIRRVKEEIRNVAAESAVAESRMSRLSNGFNRYFGTVTSGTAAVTGLSFIFRKLAESTAHPDDVCSGVMKTAGMTHDRVEELNGEFKKMDTRTSREALNNPARDAGKSGLSAKKDILDFVEAGNRINVAPGEDPGGGAVKNIGKTVNVFEKSAKDPEGPDLKGKMPAAGFAVNESGSKSTASEEYPVSFTGRTALLPGPASPLTRLWAAPPARIRICRLWKCPQPPCSSSS